MNRIVRLPDVGEGVAEAELVAWHVGVGDTVTSDTVVAEVLTDKATVEIYAPVAGTVLILNGRAGEVLAVGSDFFTIQTLEADESDSKQTPFTGLIATSPVLDASEQKLVAPNLAVRNGRESEATIAPRTASPAVRERARRLGIDLSTIDGTGPDGRVTHEDLDWLCTVTSDSSPRSANATRTGLPLSNASEVTRVPLIGLRRKIAERLTVASSRIPHITYVEEIDMTTLEHFRASLASSYPDGPRITVLPFVMQAIVRAVAEQPLLNATFDDETDEVSTSASVHIGIATQTANGLIVPVVRDAQLKDLWQIASELVRVTTAARNGTAQRAELSGSTITITSLGALGGLVTTPIINHPEVAIVGINKMQMRPLWDGRAFVPRLMMNLSSSFDHRIVDGWDAATFVQRVKAFLEEPSMLFLPRPSKPSTDG